MLTLDQLIAPMVPPVETGSGPVLAGTHAAAVAALRHFETMAAITRRQLEGSPRQDDAFDELARATWDAMCAADRAVQRFRASRDCAGEG